jgi:hypothetical protein
MKCIYMSMSRCLCTFNYLYGICYSLWQYWSWHFPWCSHILAEAMRYIYARAYIRWLLWLLSRFMATFCGLVFNSYSPLLLFISDPNYWTIDLCSTYCRICDISETIFQEKNVLRRKSDDVGWEYGCLVDASNKNKVKCMLCKHVHNGGICGSCWIIFF